MPGGGEYPGEGQRRVGLEGHADAGFDDLRKSGTGANIDDIMEWFDGLDREQVKAVIKFAARSLEKAPTCWP
jgi:hypothetical protein